MRKIKEFYASLSIFGKFTIVTVGVFFLFLITFNLVQLFVLENASQKLEVKSLREMSDRLIYELNDSQSEASDVRPFLKYYVNRNTHENLEINVLNEKGERIVFNEEQKWDSFISHQATDIEQSDVEKYQGEKYTVFRVPLKNAAGIYTVEYVKKNGTLEVILQDSLYVLILPSLFAVLLSILAGMFLSRQFVAQIHELASEVNGLRKDDFTDRLTMKHQKDELNQIRVAFNDLLSKVETTWNQQQQFIADASHELRTPVSVFKGHLQMLNRFGKSDEKILNDSLERMTKEVERFEHIIQDLLILSRVEHIEIPKDLEQIDLLPYVYEVEERFQTIDPSLVFENDWAQENGFYARIASEHFVQLLTIFVDNAFKYTNEAPKKVRIHLATYPDYILLQIQDFGMGIPADELVHVRERFFRVDKARSRSLGGAGLGLSIADRLIHLYGGEMDIQSQEDVGTTVGIRLKK